MDGWITIATKIDNSGFDKDAKALQNKIDGIEDDFNDISNLKINGIPFEEFDEAAENTKKKISEVKQEIKQVESAVSKTSGAGFMKYDTSEIQSFVDNYETATMSASRLKEQARQAKEEQRKAKEQIRQQAKATKEAEKAERQRRKEVERTQKELARGTGDNIRKLGRMALAVFGIRSAYLAISRATNILAGENKGIANDITNIQSALANALLPIILKIISFAKTLMGYVNYIWRALFGKNLFKSGADNLKSGANSAAKIKKSLQTAGFDEMTTLSDNSSSSAGGSAGVGAAGFNEEITDPEIPKWLENVTNLLVKLKDNWKLVALAILGVAAAFGIFKLASSFLTTGGIDKGVNTLLSSLGQAAKTLAIFGGFALVLSALTKLIEAFSKSGMKLTDVIGLMGTVLVTIVALMGAVALLGPAMTAGLVPFLAIVAGISTILLVMAATLPIILDACGDFITRIAPVVIILIRTISDAINDIIMLLGTVLPPIINSVGGVFEKIFGGIDKIVSTVGKTITSILKTAKTTVVDVLNAILNFINRLGPAINRFVDNAIRAITKLINFLVSGIEYMINSLVISAVNSFIGKINNMIPGSSFDIGTIGRVKINRFVPRLATGGIINMPNRGVMLGGAIAGESGAEGVIPLTDSQAMETLGEAIGRYITINANIVNSMNGRIISKELQRIKGQQEFAYNS